MDKRIAVLITGTYRELEFVLKLLPHMAGPVNYDVFLVLRHTLTDEVSRLGTQERNFKLEQLLPFSDSRVFVCELPYFDSGATAERYLGPVGPVGIEREQGQISMFQGVFCGISMMRAALRPYSHVMKTRTDYLPWVGPWLSGMLDLHEQSGGKIVVDGAMTNPQRYPDRADIPWQGSLCDLFCFASFDQFVKLWDFGEIFNSVWTGIAETTLFRAAFRRFLGDDVQSGRRNESFLQKYFSYEPNDTKQSFHFLRAGVLTDSLKDRILELAQSKRVKPASLQPLLRLSYDFVFGICEDDMLRVQLDRCLDAGEAADFLDDCHAAKKIAQPV